MINLKDADSLFDELPTYRETRRNELTGMLSDFVKVTDLYRKLISRVVVVLGNSKPKSIQDAVVRDLVCDAFDYLDYSKMVTMEGKPDIAYLLLRRAFETISLLAVCVQDRSVAEKWHNGKKFKNVDMRKLQKSMKYAEDADWMKEFYDESSDFQHPNRETIGFRFLGNGNEYTLGSIGKPDLVLVTRVCLHILHFYFWIAPILGVYYVGVLAPTYPQFIHDYDKARFDANKVAKDLNANFARLLVEAQSERPPMETEPTS